MKSYVSIRRIERRCEVVHSRDVKTFIVRIRNTLYNGMELQPDASLSKEGCCAERGQKASLWFAARHEDETCSEELADLINRLPA